MTGSGGESSREGGPGPVVFPSGPTRWQAGDRKELDSLREHLARAAIAWYRARALELMQAKGSTATLVFLGEQRPSALAKEFLAWLDHPMREG